MGLSGDECLGLVKVDWRRRDSPEGGRDDLICGMGFEGASGLPLKGSRSRVGWMEGRYVLCVVVVAAHTTGWSAAVDSMWLSGGGSQC